LTVTPDKAQQQVEKILTQVLPQLPAKSFVDFLVETILDLLTKSDYQLLMKNNKTTPKDSVTWLIAQVVFPLVRLGYQNARLARIITDVAMRLEDVREVVLSLSLKEMFWKDPLPHSKVLFHSNSAFVQAMSFVISEYLSTDTEHPTNINIEELLGLVAITH